MMQNYQQITNNLEKRSRYSEAIGSIYSKITIFKISSLLAICLIALTSMLVTRTLQIQHSCHPMIHSGALPPRCLIAAKDDFYPRTQKGLNITSQQPSRIAQNTSKAQPNIIASSTKVIEPEISQNIPSRIAKNTSKAQPNIITSSTKVIEPEISQNIPQSEPKDQSKSVGQFVNEHSDDIVGVTAGIAGGVATVAAAGATAVFSVPVAGAVLVGLGIWYTIRKVF